MATPRVFISSTYYDLRHVRNELEQFIKGFGYDPVMHDKGSIAYTQDVPLETSCYNELSQCDILVSIIGGRYGTQAEDSNYSITMRELEEALKLRKKIYIFIAKDVYTENRSYEANKTEGNFKSAYVDDIKVHEYISELKLKIKNQPIKPFDNTSEIIEELKKQFAGLLHSLLQREATLTDGKTAYDLQQSAEKINSMVEFFNIQQQEFFRKFDSSIMSTNLILKFIGKKLGMRKSMFFAKDYDSIDEFLKAIGFSSDSSFFDNEFTYKKIIEDKEITLKLSNKLFDDDSMLLDWRNSEKIAELVSYEECAILSYDLDDENLPF